MSWLAMVVTSSLLRRRVVSLHISDATQWLW